MDDKAKQIAAEFLKHFEGCKLLAYSDQRGRVTIGWGHTGGIQLGTQWAQEKADKQLLLDIDEVTELVRHAVIVPLNPNQLAALISFTFNLGIMNLRRSGLLKFLNVKKYQQAADQFLLWDHIGMYVVAGLTKRREAERALFLKDSSDEAI